jgi:plasmid stabilization system protein ParE
MTLDAWIVAAATIVGPVVAVGLTMWAQARSERRQHEFQHKLALEIEHLRDHSESSRELTKNLRGHLFRDPVVAYRASVTKSLERIAAVLEQSNGFEPKTENASVTNENNNLSEAVGSN